jgi:hypothetical protein
MRRRRSLWKWCASAATLGICLSAAAAAPGVASGTASASGGISLSAAAAWQPAARSPAEATSRMAPPRRLSPARAASDTLRDEIYYLDTQLEAVRAEMNQARPGFNRVLLAGDASPAFVSQKGSPSSLEAGLSLLILMRLSERLLFEGAFDIGLGNSDSGESETSFDLAHANLSYFISDLLTVRAGLMLAPFGVFHNHYDPPWINLLPDTPLPFGDGGIAPEGVVGVDLDTSVPIGTAELHGHLYMVNGPRLVTDDPEAAGMLSFDNFEDNKSPKTVGLRFALRPFEELECGYSAMIGRVGTGSFSGVNAFLQAMDVEYRADIDRLWGRIDLLGELVLSHVDRAAYGRSAQPPFGPLVFNNNRQGGYAQAAYRPWMVKRSVIPDLQVVARYDWLRAPLESPGGDHEERLTIGLNYWLRPSLVLMAGGEFDEKKLGEDANAFLLQVGIGL